MSPPNSVVPEYNGAALVPAASVGRRHVSRIPDDQLVCCLSADRTERLLAAERPRYGVSSTNRPPYKMCCASMERRRVPNNPKCQVVHDVKSLCGDPCPETSAREQLPKFEVKLNTEELPFQS